MSASLSINNLSFAQLKRLGPLIGGSVGILFKYNPNLINSTDLALEISEYFSCTFHQANSRQFTIIVIYRPPHQSIPKFLL